MPEGLIAALAGFGLGVAVGVIGLFVTVVRPLVHDIRSMRFAGFRPTEEVINTPKTVPLPPVRED